MQHHRYRILLRQCVHNHLITIDRHIRSLEMGQRGQHRHRCTVNDVALVVEHVQIAFQLPHFLVGHNAQRLQIDAVRVFEGALQNAIGLHGQIGGRPVGLEMRRRHGAEVELQEEQTFGGPGGFRLGNGARDLGEDARFAEGHVNAAPVGAEVDLERAEVVEVAAVEALWA